MLSKSVLIKRYFEVVDFLIVVEVRLNQTVLRSDRFFNCSRYVFHFVSFSGRIAKLKKSLTKVKDNSALTKKGLARQDASHRKNDQKIGTATNHASGACVL